MPLSACSRPTEADERRRDQSPLDRIVIETGRPRPAKKLRKHLGIKGIQPKILRGGNARARRAVKTCHDEHSRISN